MFLMKTTIYCLICRTYEQLLQNMIEIDLAEYFSMAEAMGIIGTMFIVLYFSRKQTQKLSEDIETKVLNDLAQRIMPYTRC
jgi:hypothetical protein